MRSDLIVLCYHWWVSQRQAFAVDEWYHCFNRGVDKRKIFTNEHDANRFLMLLYLANSEGSVNLFNAYKPSLSKAYETDRRNQLVAIGAFCLMPNHYHLLIKEIKEGGITSFMRKLGTAYTMYFNAKNARVGHLFSGPFKSLHVTDDRYFQRVLQYIHCNPAELYEPGWRSGKVSNMKKLERNLLEYRYSSFQNITRKRSHPILSSEIFDIAAQPPVRRMLEETNAYYLELGDNQ